MHVNVNVTSQSMGTVASVLDSAANVSLYTAVKHLDVTVGDTSFFC